MRWALGGGRGTKAGEGEVCSLGRGVRLPVQTTVGGRWAEHSTQTIAEQTARPPPVPVPLLGLQRAGGGGKAGFVSD